MTVESDPVPHLDTTAMRVALRRRLSLSHGPPFCLCHPALLRLQHSPVVSLDLGPFLPDTSLENLRPTQ